MRPSPAASALLLALLALAQLPAPASAQTPFAQVFGPTTVDPGFTTTGEKTLLTMDTTLPSGGRNVILVAYAGFTSLTARGTFRIYKGDTLLYETRITGEFLTHTRTRPFHHLLVAVDDSPAGSDTYSFRIHVSTAASLSAAVHVQGMVIKTDQAGWGYNTAAVNIAAGGTATVTSLAATFPAGSKVVVLATVYCGAATTTVGEYLVGAENIKLKAGGSVVSSNQFNIGSYRDVYPLRASLAYLDVPASSSQTYSVEVTNGASVAHNCYAEVAAFKVSDGAFLDGGSVAVATTQTTVGSLSTSLSGDVAVIALAAAERTATTDGSTFAANSGVVLQRDNSATGQIANLLAWYIFRTSYNARGGVLPMFRYDQGVSNPSYQVKMTAASGTPNGEAKIVAFTISLPQRVARTVSEQVAALDAASRGASMTRMASEAVAITDIAQALRRLLTTVLLSDSAAAADAPTRTPNYARASAELVSAADAAARQGLLRRALAELAGAADSAKRLASMARLVAEAMAVSDAVLAGFGYLRLLAEAVAAGDGASRMSAYYRALLESLSSSDLAGRVSAYLRSALDSLLADSPASRAAGILRTPADLLSASSEASRGARYARSPAEAVASGDLAGVVASLAARVVNLAESLAAGDQASPARLVVRALAEALSSLDAAGRLAGYVRGLEEGLSVVQYGAPGSGEDSAVFPIIGAYPPVETLMELVGVRDVASAVAPRVSVFRLAQMAVTLAIVMAAVGAVVVVAGWRAERRRKEEEED
jgi:hypothetical protein